MIEVDAKTVDKLRNLGFTKFYVDDKIKALLHNLESDATHLRSQPQPQLQKVVTSKSAVRKYLGDKFIVNTRNVKIKPNTQSMSIVKVLMPFHGEEMSRDEYNAKLQTTFGWERKTANKWVGNMVKAGVLIPFNKKGL